LSSSLKQAKQNALKNSALLDAAADDSDEEDDEDLEDLEDSDEDVQVL
jgi:hypothetical protein